MTTPLPHLFRDLSVHSHLSPETGSSTWAALTAVLAANIVLVAYVVIAFKEDAAERREAEKAVKGKKAQ